MARKFKSNQSTSEHWIDIGSGSVDVLAKQVQTKTELADWPLADSVEQNALLYDGKKVRQANAESHTRQALLIEWRNVFEHGPGVLLIKNAFTDLKAIDEATALFESLINRQLAEGAAASDHFAKPGTNDRVWNALEKHCIENPESFSRYYANEVIALASESWLGPCYQVTAQVNRVNPGGQAQQAHRDYHLGFMKPEQSALYPPHVHALSQVLTLQGAISHCDMPLETGPTLYLPYSQLHKEGYVSFERPEYQAFFNEHRCQLPLEKGDVVFFNPALMHAAGSNQTKDKYRLANLLQVSSAFGRSIESVNRTRMIDALYPSLLERKTKNDISEIELQCVIAASAEGYAFPTNLDTDPPVGGLAPLSQAVIVNEALNNATDAGTFRAQLYEHAKRRL